MSTPPSEEESSTLTITEVCFFNCIVIALFDYMSSENIDIRTKSTQ